VRQVEDREQERPRRLVQPRHYAGEQPDEIPTVIPTHSHIEPTRRLSTPATRILDLGCGPATMWLVNRERVDPSWSLTLADLSAGGQSIS
jgi:hypothetical protein